MAKKQVITEKLADTIKRHGMLKENLVLKAVILNHEIINNALVYIDKEKRLLTLEYTLPFDLERHIITSMRDSGIELTREITPERVIQNFLYSLASGVYYYIAKENNWNLSWVDKHIKAIHKASKGMAQDTVIRIAAHPMSDNEIKDYILKSMRDYYIAVKTATIKNFNEERVKVLDILKDVDDKHDKFLSVFLKELVEYGIIDKNLKVLCSESQFDKALKIVVQKIADKNNERTAKCRHSACSKVFLKTRSDRKYCSDSCRIKDNIKKKREREKEREKK